MASAELGPLARRSRRVQRRRAFWVLFWGLLSTVLCARCSADRQAHQGGAPPDSADSDFDHRLEEARDRLNVGDFAPARDALVALVQQAHPGTPGARATLLWGKAEWALGHDVAAAEAFELVRQDFPKSAEAPKAQHKLGWMALMAGDRAQAARRWGDLGGSREPLWPEGNLLAAWAGGTELTPGFADPGGPATRKWKDAKEQLLWRDPMAEQSFELIAQQGQLGKATGSKAELQRHRARFFLGKAHLGMGDVQRTGDAWLTAAKGNPGGEWGGRAAVKLAILALVYGDVEQARGRLAEVQRGPLAAEAEALRRWLATDPDLPDPLR